MSLPSLCAFCGTQCCLTVSSWSLPGGYLHVGPGPWHLLGTARSWAELGKEEELAQVGEQIIQETDYTMVWSPQLLTRAGMTETTALATTGLVPSAHWNRPRTLTTAEPAFISVAASPCQRVVECFFIFAHLPVETSLCPTHLWPSRESKCLADPKATAMASLGRRDNTWSCCFPLDGIALALGLVRRESGS